MSKKDIEKKVSKSSLIAKKDHIIFQNNFRLEIKEGEDLSKVKLPERFIQTLKTEKVI